LEFAGKGVLVRDLNKQKVVRQETGVHVDTISAATWINEDIFATAAGSQVTVWQVKSESPLYLLESGDSAPIHSLSAKTSSKGRFYIQATGQKSSFFYKLKTSQESNTKTV
jgi:hypothetical protein